MNSQSITIKQVIGMSIDDLKGLRIPADLLDEFGPRISRVLNNLKVVYTQLDEAEKQMAAQAQAKAAMQSQENLDSDDVENGAPIIHLVEEELDDAEEKDQLESPIQE